MKKFRVLVVSLMIAALSLFPMASPALATHSCAFEPGSLEQELCENTPHRIFDTIDALICKILPIC